MVDHRHYIPILKGKAGEYDALKHLAPGVKPQLTPIIEVPPIEPKYGAELGVLIGAKTTIDEHVSRVPQNIRKAWGTDFRSSLICCTLKNAATLQTEHIH